jgi:uncharacterized protein (DUF427 family)
MGKKIAKKYKWKAQGQKHKSRMWFYFSSKDRARRWAGKRGKVRKR